MTHQLRETEPSIHFLKKVIKRLLSKGSQQQLHLFFHKYHEADIADALEEMSNDDRVAFFKKLNPEMAADVLEEMDADVQIQLLSDYKSTQVAHFIEEMDPDNAVDLLEELIEDDEEKAEAIMDSLPKKEADDLKNLLAYPEDTAGALMTNEYLWIRENLYVKDAISMFRKKVPPESELSFYIYIVDSEGVLIGVTSLRNLVLAEFEQRIKSIRNDAPISVHVTMDQEDVARLMQKYNLVVLPVVDDLDRIVGVITVDDVVDVVVEEATEDLYKLSGTSEIDESKLLNGKIYHALLSRTPWLILTVVGGLVASLVMKYFSTTIPLGYVSMALFLSFVPLLMGLGGNIGNQSATIIVRGLSTDVLRGRAALSIITREVLVGGLIGAFLGAVVFVALVLMNHLFSFAAIVGISVLINSLVASFLGTSLPIFLKKSKIDPAVASAPFISSTLDILGQIIYFVTLIIAITYYIQ